MGEATTSPPRAGEIGGRCTDSSAH